MPRCYATIVLATSIVWAPGLFAQTGNRRQAARVIPIGAPSTNEVVWPPLPEPTRIRYAGVLRSEADLGKRRSPLGIFARLVAGTPPPIEFITRPHDVWVDGRNRVYVTDAGRRRVLRFDPGTKSAAAIGEAGLGRIAKPMGLSGTADGRVFVADQAAKRVVEFDAQGKFRRAFGGEHELINPVDVAVDTLGNLLYVADSYLHQIVVFDIHDGRIVRRLGRTAADVAAKRNSIPTSTGAHDHGAATLGHPAGYSPEPRDVIPNRGSEPGEFRYPSFVAVGRDGRLYVSDALNFRIQVFDRDGRFVRAFGTLGDGPGQFARPKGVAVDSEGHVYVVDAAFGNVQVFDAKGRLLLVFGSMGHGDGELWLPEGLHIDALDRVYVGDRFNNRVQIYQYVHDAGPLVPASPQR